MGGVCRWIRWLVASNIATEVLCNIFLGSLAARIAAVLTHLLLAVPWALCLRTSVVKSLLKVAGVLYYLLSINTGMTMTILIYGPTWWGEDRDAVARAFAFCLGRAVMAVGLTSCLALADAAPSHILPRPVRLFVFTFITIYKSGLCTSFGSCCASSTLPFTPPSHVCTGASQPRPTWLTSTAPIMSQS